MSLKEGKRNINHGFFHSLELVAAAERCTAASLVSE